MHRAGYVLTGGRSSRMGRDKALLPFGNRTLVECVAQNVKEAAGSVTLVGPASEYGFLGLPLIEDEHRGCGPLSGIEAALADPTSEWKLVVACDMPNLTSHWLRQLLDMAVRSGVDAVIPTGPGGFPEPLCAVYRRTCLDAARQALRAGRFKITEAFGMLQIEWVPAMEPRWLVNANTPEEWEAIHAAQVVHE